MKQVHRGLISAWIVAVIIAAGCLPYTSATIELGKGYSSGEVDRIEQVLEKSGFSRVWFGGPSGERISRMERDGKVVSGFATEAPRGIGASVAWGKADGSLTVQFSEYDTRFSERGNRLLESLLAELRLLYGQNNVHVLVP